MIPLVCPKHIKVRVIGLIAVLLCMAPHVYGANDPGLAERLDAVVGKAVARQEVVGAVVVVLKDGDVVYHRAAGLADREAGRLMREDTIFRFASLSKPIVSLALLRLAEEGRLNLDDPVTKYLPEFKPRLADGTAPEITLRQILTHTAGLSSDFLRQTDIPFPGSQVSIRSTPTNHTMGEALHRIEEAGLNYAPGRGWGYSLGIDILGVVMEQVSGMTLGELVQQLVTDPAGLADTSFAPPDPIRLATPYADGKPPIRMGDPHLVPFPGHIGILFSPGRIFDTAFATTAGSGMCGTAGDMAHLLELVRTGGGGLVKPETAQSMMMNQIGKYISMNGPGWGFGYGGGVLTDPKAAKTPQSEGTWSWGGVWGHTWFVDPKRGLVVVALTNTAVEGVSGRFPFDIRDAVYNTPPVDLSAIGD